MRNFSAFRLCSHLLFCFALLSFFEPFCGDLRAFWLLCALAFPAALIAARLKRPLLRLLPALLPFGALLLPFGSWLSFGAAAAAALYAAVVLVCGLFWPEPWVYRREAVWLLSLSGLLLIVSFFWTNSGVETTWLLVCGAGMTLLALRMQQISGSMGPAWQAASIGFLAAVASVGLAVASLLRAIGAERLLKPFVWFAQGCSYLVALFIGVFSWLVKVLFARDHLDDGAMDIYVPELFFNTDGNPKPSSQLTTDADIKPIQVHIPWLKVLLAVVLLILLGLAVRFLIKGGAKRLRQYLTQTANGAEVPEARAQRQRAKKKPTDNREQIRWLYGSYLRYLSNRNIGVTASDTTAEISDAASKLFIETDELLRSLYRKARYSSEDISDEEVEAALESYNRLTAVENQKSESA